MKTESNYISRYYFKDTQLFFLAIPIVGLFNLIYFIRLFVSQPTVSVFLLIIFVLVLGANFIAKNFLKQNYLDLYQDKMVFCFFFFFKRTVYYKDISRMMIWQRNQARYLRFFSKKLPWFEITSLRIFSTETGDTNFLNIVYTLNNYIDSTIL